MQPNTTWITWDTMEICLPKQAISEICHPGQNIDAVEHWAPIIKAMPEQQQVHPTWAVTPEKVRKALEGYGAWEPEELLDDDENYNRAIWLAAWEEFDET